METASVQVIDWARTLVPIAVLVLLIADLLFTRLTLRLFGVVLIPEDKIGIVNKKFVLFGANKTLPDGKIIALNGEAGYQADTLAPGLHWGYWPWQYTIEMNEFTVVPPGMVGVVEARDGGPVMEGRALGKVVACDAFQDAREFLDNGGQRGPQLAIIRPGTYRINTSLFTVKFDKATVIGDAEVGIVTTKDGKQLPDGDVAGPVVPGHQMFQDGQAFIDNGGCRGPQEQVILAGIYYLNPMFASLERVPLTEVAIAHCGVVISFVGPAGKDLTGAAFAHGNLVKRGEKGVWIDPFDPGKFPLNTRTMKLEQVPTANIVLNWATGRNEAHKLDEKLSTITVRSKDGFTFNLDVSQIIHIPRDAAPKVIVRFGSVAALVTQVLEPLIGNYFRNAAQNSDAIDFLTSRTQRQEEAKKAIEVALKEYDVKAIDTLIGDINPPEDLMKTLTDRKLADQRKTTYAQQRDAERARQELEQERALADTQKTVVDAERQVSIAKFKAQAAIEQARGASEAKTINAKADAEVTRVNGDADAGKTRAIGGAEAEVIQLKTNAMDPDNFALVETARALAQSKVPIVPGIVAGGGGSGDGSSLMNVFMAKLIASQSEERVSKPAAAVATEVTAVTAEEEPKPSTEAPAQS